MSWILRALLHLSHTYKYFTKYAIYIIFLSAEHIHEITSKQSFKKILKIHKIKPSQIELIPQYKVLLDVLSPNTPPPHPHHTGIFHETKVYCSYHHPLPCRIGIFHETEAVVTPPTPTCFLHSFSDLAMTIWYVFPIMAINMFSSKMGTSIIKMANTIFVNPEYLV